MSEEGVGDLLARTIKMAITLRWIARVERRTAIKSLKARDKKSLK